METSKWKAVLTEDGTVKVFYDGKQVDGIKAVGPLPTFSKGAPVLKLEVAIAAIEWEHPMSEVIGIASEVGEAEAGKVKEK